MFINRRKYELEKQWLEERIDQLEWLICRGEHDYIQIDVKTIADGCGYGDLTHKVYQCKRCGKVSD